MEIFLDIKHVNIVNRFIMFILFLLDGSFYDAFLSKEVGVYFDSCSVLFCFLVFGYFMSLQHANDSNTVELELVDKHG